MKSAALTSLAWPPGGPSSLGSDTELPASAPKTAIRLGPAPTPGAVLLAAAWGCVCIMRSGRWGSHTCIKGGKLGGFLPAHRSSLPPPPLF